MIFKSATTHDSGGYVDGFNGDGFTCAAIIYAVFSVASWLAPSAVAIKGENTVTEAAQPGNHNSQPTTT